jgi:hypothetical protein
MIRRASQKDGAFSTCTRKYGSLSCHPFHGNGHRQIRIFYRLAFSGSLLHRPGFGYDYISPLFLCPDNDPLNRIEKQENFIRDDEFMGRVIGLHAASIFNIP